jgi:hypothetical protein
MVGRCIFHPKVHHLRGVTQPSLWILFKATRPSQTLTPDQHPLFLFEDFVTRGKDY